MLADTGKGQIDPVRLKALLKGLVDIYSPSGKEGEILEYVESYLRRFGFNPTRQEIDDKRYNLVLFPPGRDEVELCLVGHLDTISAYELEEFSFREEEDNIFGLGAADMKGGCAAMIEAYIALAGSGGAMPPVGLAMVVDEEDENRGAEALSQEYIFPWAVVGEPTNLEPCLGHYGYLEVMLRTYGKRAHSAMPEKGQNAIENMLKLLLKVTEYATTRPHGLVYNVRDLSGFPTGFVVPDTCEVYIDFHLPPNSRMDVLRSDLEQVVREARESTPGLKAGLHFEYTHSGYKISEDRPMIARLRQVYSEMSLPWQPQDFRSDSDASILWADGVDPIILGPGHLEAAHSPDEVVPFSQVLQAARIYLRLAQSLQMEAGKPAQ